MAFNAFAIRFPATVAVLVAMGIAIDLDTVLRRGCSGCGGKVAATGGTVLRWGQVVATGFITRLHGGLRLIALGITLRTALATAVIAATAIATWAATIGADGALLVGCTVTH
jgi:hypothetical protein